MRAVFASSQLKVDVPASLLIIAARDQETTKRLLPQFSAHNFPLPGGLFVHGWEREYALVRLDVIPYENQSFSSVCHEYVHSVLHANFRWLPAWLDEGISDFYANTNFEKTRAIIGALPPSYSMRILAEERPIPLADFITSPLYVKDPEHTRLAYLQAWGLTHFLMMSPEMEHGQRLGRFIAALQNGTDQKKAFEDIFGSFAQVQREYKSYIDKATFPSRILTVPSVDAEKQYTVRTLSSGETDAELAAWFIRFHDWNHMREFTEAALAKGPKLSLAHEDQAFLLYNDGHDEEAFKEFCTAVDLDASNYVALFARTMISAALKSQSPPAQQTMVDELNHVIDLKPDFAPAYVELAKLYLKTGNPTLALAMAKRAEEIEPFRSGYHVLSGRILLLLNRPEDAAAEAALVSQGWSGADRDEAMELLRDIRAVDKHVEQSDAIAPDEHNADWKETEGTVKDVSCNGNSFAITLDVKGSAQVFKTQGFPVGFSDTLWVGHDHFSPCFHVQGLRAAVKYKPPKDNSYAGDLVVAGFRDDLSPPSSRTVAAGSGN